MVDSSGSELSLYNCSQKGGPSPWCYHKPTLTCKLPHEQPETPSTTIFKLIRLQFCEGCSQLAGSFWHCTLCQSADPWSLQPLGFLFFLTAAEECECENGGICSTGLDGGMLCHCQKGFAGVLCEQGREGHRTPGPRFHLSSLEPTIDRQV